MEERLGAILVLRGQPCALTNLGKALTAHFDKVQLLEADLGPALGTKAVSSAPPVTLKVAVNADGLGTWFPHAVAGFTQITGIMLDVVLEDEGHASDRLRSGEVVAAVTADPNPVQGCKTIPLGTLRYVACASPAFVDRHFPDGVDPSRLAGAPYLRFDRRDWLQARWARDAHGTELGTAVHWMPSTQAFLDFALLGVAWGLQPVLLAQPHIAAGRLVELPPAMPLDVMLYWTVARLHAASLRALTDAVVKAASDNLQACTS
ncbi:ArgP/LysG family DNA-binding transcriptional regulator [Novosphingobium endophyticum]|uniref:ArgP/LysG family DNA-binding transcriptional regulator n=1 Tax=Novosphingobium endophyticum TaxID=1955250 RepID=UPI003570B6B6